MAKVHEIESLNNCMNVKKLKEKKNYKEMTGKEDNDTTDLAIRRTVQANTNIVACGVRNARILFFGLVGFGFLW